MGELNFCTLADILKTASEALINDLSTDAGLPYLLTRAFHNKLLPYLYHGLRCFLLYLDLSQLSTFVPRLAIPFIGYALFERRFRKILLTTTLTLPCFFIVNPFSWQLGTRIYLFSGYYTLLGLLGGIKLLTRK